MEEEFIAAAEDGDLDEVRRLVNSGEVVDPNTADMTSDGRTALHVASMNGHLPVVEQLVEKWRVDVDVGDRHGWTPLHLACWQGHLQVAKCLVEKGHASIDDAQDSADHTPLHYACSNGSLELIEYLVEDRKADATMETNIGETPLLIACARGFIAVVSFLLPHSPVDAKVLKLAWRRRFPWYLKMEIVEKFSRQRLGRPDGYFTKYPLHTLLQCPLPSEEAFLECLYGLYNVVNAISSTDERGRLPLHILLQSARTTRQITPYTVAETIRLEPRAETARDPSTGFLPYQTIACVIGTTKFDFEEDSDEEESSLCDEDEDDCVSDLSDSDSGNESDDEREEAIFKTLPKKASFDDVGTEWLDFMYRSIRDHDPAKLLRPCISSIDPFGSHDSQV